MGEWIRENLDHILERLKLTLLDVLNWFIEALCDALNFVTSWLPDYTLPTFAQISNEHQALGLLNFFFPVDVLIVIAGMWATSEGLYLVSAPVLRWLKLVGR